MKNRPIEHLFDMIRARYGAVVVTTNEEQRFLRVLGAEMAQADFVGKPVVIRQWSVTDGLHPKEVGGQNEGEYNKRPEVPDRTTLELKAALREVINTPPQEGTLFVFKDVHAHISDKSPKESAEIIRLLRDCAQTLRSRNNVLLLLSPSFPVPPELEKELTVFDFPLPDEIEMRGVVQNAYNSWTKNFGLEQSEKFSHEIVAELARACMGMTELEAEDALMLGMFENKGWGRKLVPNIHMAKQEAIKRVGCLEAIEVTHGMEAVGGLDVLKGWVAKRKDIFSDEAKAFGVGIPKGLMTLGVPGGGKSLAAKAVAASWNLPLIRLDMGAVMGMWLGQSEGNLKRALKVAEALSPCVLWIDEVEKSLAGNSGGPSEGGGTTMRVFGNLLTWMQEKESPVILYFTANDVTALPAPLLRKGRIDEIFYVDLPSLEERKEILSIHLKKRGRDPKQFDLEALSKSCRGFVGAEIEQGIQESIIDAFAAKLPEVTTEVIAAAFGRTTPLVKIQAEQMKVLRKFVEDGRAVRASSTWEKYELELPTPAREMPTRERRDEARGFIAPGTEMEVPGLPELSTPRSIKKETPPKRRMI